MAALLYRPDVNSGSISVGQTQHWQLNRVLTLLVTKKSRTFPGPPWEIYQDLFWSPWMLKCNEKTLPSPPDPWPPSPSLPLEVGPFKSSYGIWASAVSSLSMGSQLRSNLVHFSLKIWHLMATIFNYFARNQLTKFSARDAGDFSNR